MLNKADLPQHLVCRDGIFTKLARDLHVFQRCHVGKQIIKLEHKADLVPTVGRQPFAVKPRHILARQQHMAGGQPVHAAQNVEKRRLARAGLSDDHADLPLRDRKRGILQSIDAHIAHPIGLADMIEQHKILHTEPLLYFF